MQMMIKEDPVHRASMDDLFNSEFIKRHENRALANQIISNSLSLDLRPNMYKFYIAYMLNEIVSRTKKNVLKKAIIGETWDAFAAEKKKEREERRRKKKKEVAPGEPLNLQSDEETNNMLIDGRLKLADFYQHIH